MTNNCDFCVHGNIHPFEEIATKLIYSNGTVIILKSFITTS